MKADDKMCIGENNEQKEKYSYFDYLIEKVEVLREQIDLIARILEQHNLRLKISETAERDVEDETFKRLEEKKINRK